jgi:L-ascorbate metabolism protein UlaG (beta-lactamase superfamily)
MHIIWKGQSCFQIIASQAKGEQVKIVIDPFSEEIGLKLGRPEADLLLITHDHHDHNNVKAVSGQPFLISWPGEYETKGIFIQGVSSLHGGKEAQRIQNTIYIIEGEGMRVCHLGDLGQAELNSSQLEKIGSVDILMIPVGGEYTVDAKGAAKVISQIEPRIVLPMHYHLPKLKIKLDGVDKFLKEMGRKSVETLPKLLIKKKDLPQNEMKVVVLKP